MSARPGPANMQQLVFSLKAKGIIKDARVEATMLRVDRGFYCPSEQPYLDEPHPIGCNATISAPHMHAYALEYLKDHLRPGARVLDVGSGSGYLTACLALMVGNEGKVFGVEHIKELTEKSKSNIKADCPGLIESGRLTIVHSDGRIGLPEYSPFDVIHVGAGADGLPQSLVDQLSEGGRMVIPVQDQDGKQEFESVDRRGNEVVRQKLLRVRYIPLTDAEAQWTGR